MVPNTTAISPMFLRTAHDIGARVGHLEGGVAGALAREAGELATIFRSWETARPADAARVAAIQQLFDLNRRAMDFLSKGVPPSSRVRPTLSSADDDEEDEHYPVAIPLPSRSRGTNGA